MNLIARLLVIMALALPFDVEAQESGADDKGPAVLVADRVFITSDRVLVAEGNVEAFQGDIRLRADKITFDRTEGKLTVQGPIRIDQGGSMVVLADFAELDEGLQNGLLTGARMVLDQQLQLASLQMARVNGRYTQLYKTAVTSCHVCGDGRPPLWQIRARTITHDQEERQLYFEDAQFLILGTPVMYFPGMRLPDPTLERASGFLIPKIRSTSNLGTGVKVPYFFRLGDHADLTLAPYISSATRTLEYRYRQAFRNGRMSFEGAHTRDNLQPDDTRGYVFGAAQFDLPRGFRLDFALQLASDNSYLVDYGLPDLDRLRSEIAISRYRQDSAFRTRLLDFESLRDADDESLLPTVVVEATYERRFFPRLVGGELRAGLMLHTHQRSSDLDVLGRDVRRATADLSWQRHWLMDNGLRTDWEIGISADAFRIRQDSTAPAQTTRITPRSALTFSYPMTMTTGGGTVHYVEPIVQLGWTHVSGAVPPNDESTFVELDQGNLLSLSRFPAPDRRESGRTLAYGLNWAAYAANGWQASATVGRVKRANAEPDFTRTSGMSGTTSDVLVAGQLRYSDKLSLTARTLLDNAFSLSKAEVRGDWTSPKAQLAGSYLWLGPDAAEGRPQALSEVWFNGGYQVATGWTANASLRYDISDQRATRAGLGFVYRNECVTVDLGLNRRYTSSTSIEPSTDIGFTISLSGFSVDAEPNKYRRSCS
ncbi:LPS-assembly protein LptD [Seohaeicola nanhaiensis]|uniref:LPS-assembly protein LptD n=1 Tax=Seohaeicola nanhaiensis TaxID=1387282 RepID=A0ABV9KDJ0_9RHOB